MRPAQDNQASVCGGGCSRCGQAADDGAAASSLRGWRLVAAAAGVLLAPPVAAMVGALIGGAGGAGRTGQFVGAAIGLAVGLALVGGAARMHRNWRKEHP